MKCLPSGKKEGYAWELSWRERSTIVTAEGTPPVDETREIGFPTPPKIITPSRFQAPPKTGSGASHRVCGGPPEASTFLSFPAAPNTIKRLSGDQNEYRASSVPARGCASGESRARTHSRVRPSGPVAVKAMRRPSGDTRGKVRKLDFSGGGIRNRTGSATGGFSRKWTKASGRAATANRPATSQPSHDLRCRAVGCCSAAGSSSNVHASPISRNRRLG